MDSQSEVQNSSTNLNEHKVEEHLEVGVSVCSLLQQQVKLLETLVETLMERLSSTETKLLLMTETLTSIRDELEETRRLRDEKKYSYHSDDEFF